MDIGIIVYLLWAVGSMFVWGLVLVDDLRQFRFLQRNHLRERRHLSVVGTMWSDFALVLVAIASGASIIALAVAKDIPGVRGLALAIALGAFLGAGLVKYSFRRRRP